LALILPTDRETSLCFDIRRQEDQMQGPLRGILAGAAAWKFGGGCISTILIFIIVFWLLGYVRC